MVQPLVRFKKILGIDNTSDLASDRIRGQGIYLYECDNVDIDDEGKPHRRDGDSELVFPGSFHSGWSNGKIFLYVNKTNATLNKLNLDNSATVLITDVNPTDRMCYLDVNNVVYFANNSIIGYIVNDLPYPFVNPNQDFKQRMIGGQALEFYNSRLYSANGSNVFFSDATVPGRMDKRKNAIAFPNRVTLLKAVGDGIYVGTSKGVWFEKGSDPVLDFVENKISDIGAKEGTGIVNESDDIGHGATGKVAYWIDNFGCPNRGLPGGISFPCQGGLFVMPDLDAGTSILLYVNGYYQYISICPLIPGIGGSEGKFTIPRMSMTGHMA
jgi:hypothetical protein